MIRHSAFNFICISIIRGFAAASLELSQGVNEEEKAKALAAATSELERLFKKADFKQMKVSIKPCF